MARSHKLVMAFGCLLALLAAFEAYVTHTRLESAEFERRTLTALKWLIVDDAPAFRVSWPTWSFAQRPQRAEPVRFTG